MPLDSPPSGAPRGASTRLAGALLCVLLVNVCASLPGGHKCPQRLDCASEGRHFCKPGSAHCGPCLTPLVENQEGRCVVKGRHRPHGNVLSYPEVDQEIDFLHSVVEKQQVAAVVPKQSRTQAPETKQRSRPLKEISANSTDISPAPAPGPPTPQPRATGAVGRAGPIAAPTSRNDTLIILLITLCISVGTVALVLAAVCFIRFQKDSRSTQKVDYPAFKGAGMPPATANTISLGDKTLAQSAQMYHYQHQKQQMISMGKPKPEQKVPDSEVTSDEEEVGGDFTVYECPGLAPTGEMEVKNPLFDDSTLYYQGNHK